jgi:hypothetical protein
MGGISSIRTHLGHCGGFVSLKDKDERDSYHYGDFDLALATRNVTLVDYCPGVAPGDVVVAVFPGERPEMNSKQHLKPLF